MTPEAVLDHHKAQKFVTEPALELLCSEQDCLLPSDR